MSLIRNSLIYFFSNVCSAMIPFLLLPVLTHYLSPESFGEISMFQALVVGLGAFIGVNGVGATNRKFFDKDLDSKQYSKYNTNVINVIFISAFLVICLFLLFGQFFSKVFSIKEDWLFLAIYYCIFISIYNLCLGQCQIRDKAIKFGGFQLLQSFVNIFLSLFFIIYLNFGSDGRVYGMVASLLLLSVLSFLYLYYCKYIYLWNFNFFYMKDIINFGVPLIPHTLSFFLISYADRFIINDMLGKDKVAFYSIAIQLSLCFSMVFESISKSYFPWLFRQLAGGDVSIKVKIVKWTYLFNIVVLLFSMLSFFIAPFFIELFLSKEYQSISNIIGFIFLGQSFNGMYLLVVVYITYAKKNIYISIVTFFCGVLNIPLTICLIKMFGIEGAAISFSVVNFIIFLLTWLLAS